MNLAGSALVQEFCCFSQLGAADNGVVNQEKTLVTNQGIDRNQLHFRNQVTLTLVLRHKGTGPGWCVFNKGTGKGNAGFIGIADSVGNAGIGNSGHNIRVNGLFFAVVR